MHCPINMYFFDHLDRSHAKLYPFSFLIPSRAIRKKIMSRTKDKFTLMLFLLVLPLKSLKTPFKPSRYRFRTERNQTTTVSSISSALNPLTPTNPKESPPTLNNLSSPNPGKPQQNRAISSILKSMIFDSSLLHNLYSIPS